MEALEVEMAQIFTPPPVQKNVPVLGFALLRTRSSCDRSRASHRDMLLYLDTRRYL